MLEALNEDAENTDKSGAAPARRPAKPLRILMAHNRYLERGGEDSVTEAEIDLLRQNGCKVGLYERDNTEIDKQGLARTSLSSIWSRETYSSVRALLRQDKYDVVHVQNFFPLISPAIYDAAHAEGVPVVQTIHNFRLFCPGGNLLRDGQICEKCVGKAFAWPGVVHGCYRGSRSSTASVATTMAAHSLAGTWQNKVDRFIALSEFSRRKLVEGGLPESKLTVKPNFVLPDPGASQRARSFFLYVGRLSQEKGLNGLLDAWETAHIKVPLLIVGDGPDAEQLKARTQKNSGVEFLGHKPLNEVMELMGQAIALCFPSLCYENLPRTIIESFAVATPVIAYDHGAMSGLIEDGKTGFLANPGDARDFVMKSRSATGDRPSMARMGRSARRTFEDNYTGDANFRQLKDIYEGAIREYRR